MISDSNKEEYVEKVVDYICYESIQDKINALLKGFFSVINKKIIQIFTVEELDFIISGQIEINLSDWRENTIYKGHYNDKHHVSLNINAR